MNLYDGLAVADTASELVLVYVTAPENEAPAIAKAIVDRRLAACVNIVPKVRSIYVWEGATQDDSESLMIIKTTRAGFEALRAAVIGLHPYDVPEVIAVRITDAHPPYREWVVGSVAKGEP